MHHFESHPGAPHQGRDGAADAYQPLATGSLARSGQDHGTTENLVGSRQGAWAAVTGGAALKRLPRSHAVPASMAAASVSKRASRTVPGYPIRPHPQPSPTERVTQAAWCESIEASMNRNGQLFVPSPPRSAARPKRYGAGYGRPSGIAASGRGLRPPSGNGSRRWSKRYGNCARHRLILRRRSSTARSSDESVHRPASRCLWGRADRQGVADRPVDILPACGPTEFAMAA